AVPAAGLAGAALPGCECASVPIAARLAAGGVTPAAALTFMLAAPAINPVVLVATAVAFPGRPQMVVGRFLGSLLASVAVGLLWTRVGRGVPVAGARRAVPGLGRWESFSHTARHDFLEAGGWLVVGAMAAATLQVVVPRGLLDQVAGNHLLAAVALGLLAVVLAICSEADAFVAASLQQFSLSARLVFLVVGPAVDVKLIAMQAGMFGRRFALRFPALTFVVTVGSALLVGRWLL
ncbi:MAG TPA: permease, partial [Actinomycetes bacterium]